METVYIVLVAAFAAYIATVGILYRIPASISESFYHPKIGHLFTLWCVSTGIGACVLMAELSGGQWYQFLCLFAGGGLLTVGVAPRFKTHDRTVHYAGAGTCALAAVAWMCAAGYGYIPIPLVATIGGLAYLLDRRKLVFWVELALFVSMFITLFLMI
ncbi:MAG: hypothetical protein LBJ01_07635 [Tannerella sp.]|jgi:hypothetical protein|nr:hypothetical protein [Tannerella sp.]